MTYTDSEQRALDQQSGSTLDRRHKTRWQIFSQAFEVLDRKQYETEEAARNAAAEANTRNPLGKWGAVEVHPHRS